MGESAISSLLLLIPIALRINIYIVNLDLSSKQQVRKLLNLFLTYNS